MIDQYTLFLGATRILMVHNLQNWESAEIYYYSRHNHHTHESVKFEELEPQDEEQKNPDGDHIDSFKKL